MSNWMWTLVWLLIFAAMIGGTIWYGMSLIADADVRGVPLP